MFDRRGGQDWRECSVFDLARWKNGLAFKNIDFSPAGRPVIKIAELKAGVTPQTARTDANYDHSVFVKAGDMLFSWSGNPDTSIDVFRWRGEPGWLNQHIFKVTPAEGVDDEFLFFLLRWLRPRFAEIARNKQTTGLGHVTLQDLKRMMVGVPTTTEQQRIVSVVAPYERKIELNRRMNETLEAMAQAIFRDWFVDFGPVRRKMEGATDPVAIMGGLTPDPERAAELAALFPTALGDNGLPRGWSERAIGGQVEIAGGATPSTGDLSLWEPAEHRWATPKDLSTLADLALSDTARRISSAGLAKISSGLLPPGTVLLSSRAPIGYLAIAQEPVSINQGFIALKPNAGLGSAYLYLWCKANMEAILANANGSTFQEISKKNFRPITSATPDDQAVFDGFNKVVAPLIDRIVAAAKENRTLAETRDYLLPRLMSGQVRVGDGEAMVA